MPDGTVSSVRKPQPAAESHRDRNPIQDLITRLNRDAVMIAGRDPELARRINQLSEAATRPGQLDNHAFRTNIAYALQDLEKLSAPISTLPSDLREEMTRLAASAPGLQNARLKELMSATPSISDGRLVGDIRTLAREAARDGVDQNGPGIVKRIEDMERRVRIAGAASAAQDGATEQPRPQTPSQASNPSARSGPFAAGEARPVRSPGTDGNDSQPGWSQRPPPTNQPSQPLPAPQNEMRRHDAPVNARGAGAISALALAALSRHAQRDNPPWERQPTPIADRAARHEAVFQQRRDQTIFAAAEQSQRAALDAIQSFANGPGASILAKIQDAAKTDPGGLQAVLSEMREGGRYAGLRAQFNADLALERGTAAAWEKMTGRLQQYGVDRGAVAAIGARTNATQALDARFEKMDAEIGKAAAMLPSRRDGKSVLDDFGDQIKEVLERAIQTVKAALSAAPEKSTRPSPAPTPR